MKYEEKMVDAKREAKRFLQRVKEWEDAQGAYESGGRTYRVSTPKQSGAVRRASMDLTRSLANLRRYGR